MVVDRAKFLGWSKPTDRQTIRALYRAHPLHAISLPSAAPAANNSALTCRLDQLDRGTCHAQTVAQTIYMEQLREGKPPFVPSAMAIAYWTRNLDGNADVDSGACIGSSYFIAAEMGIPSEATWPYLSSRFVWRPAPYAYRDAFDRRGQVSVNYFPIVVNRADVIERVLTSGRGVSFGVQVSEAFCAMLPNDVVQAPEPGERIAGGHALAEGGQVGRHAVHPLKQLCGKFHDRIQARALRASEPCRPGGINAAARSYDGI